MPITKLISGGQTGADRGGLDAAIYCDVSHGGWCPKGRKAEDGRIPAEYGLVETTSGSYLDRTKRNVVVADATVVFTLKGLSGGSLRTVEFARDDEKPWLHVDLGKTPRQKAAEQVAEWLDGRGDYDHDEYKAQPPANCTLNVAGSRESKADGIQELVAAIMVDVLRAVNPECVRFYPLC